jgi:iron(III) transport system permease protein
MRHGGNNDLSAPQAAAKRKGAVVPIRQRILRSGAGARLAVLGLLLIVGYLIVPPLMVIILGSLTDTPPGVRPRFTLDTLSEVYGDRELYQSLAWSILYAASTSTLAMLLGGGLAWQAARTDSRLHHLTDFFTLAPILVPAVLFVTGWLLLLGPKGGLINLWLMETFNLQKAPFNLYSFGGMIWVGTLQELPLAFLWLWPPLRAMNPDLEDAAFVAGAGFPRVVWRVTFPLLRPAILSGWMLTFIYGLGALAVPMLIGIPSGHILYATEIFLAIHRVPADFNLASAYSLLLVVSALGGLFVYRRFTREQVRFTTITGKAFRPRIIALGRWRPLADSFGIVILLLVAGLPLLVLFWNAFLPFPQAPSVAALGTLTLRNFTEALNYGAAARALVDSLLLGTAAGVISTMLGAVIAWSILRSKAHGFLVAALDQLSTLPVSMPGLIVGLSLLWLYLILPLPIYGTFWILLIAYVTLHLPYAVRICASGLMQLHEELEEAAYVHGATWPFVFRRIVLALMVPNLLTSILYVGLRSFREYAASILLAGPGTEVFSVMVLDMWDGGNLNILCAYVTMVTVLLGALVWLCNWLISRQGLKLA